MAKKIPIAVAASGDNVVVTGVPGYLIRVVVFHLTFSGVVNATWGSGTGGSFVALGGPYYGIAGTAVDVDDVEGPDRFHFETAAGADLNLKLSGAVAVGGHLIYELYPA